MKFPEKMPQQEIVPANKTDDEEYYESIVVEEGKKEAPIKKGEVFDPATVKDILKLPSKDRRAALEAYKEKLAYQKEGLAEMQEDLTGAIYENPNAKRTELVEITDEYAEKYGFTSEQLETIEHALDKYKEKRREVINFLMEHPENEERYEELFGVEPKGKIEIIEGPMTIYFRCHDPDDYARIFYQHRFTEKGDGYVLTKEEKDKANLSGGVSVPGARIEGLRGTIIAENARGREFDEDSQSIYVHEEQHAIKRLLETEAMDREVLRALKEAGDKPEEKKRALEISINAYLEERERVFEDYAKDEILAYMKGGHRSVENIIETLERKKEAGGLYDYMGEDKDFILSDAVKEFSDYVSFDETETRKITEKVVEKVYNKENFNKTIRGGIKAFIDLYRTYSGDGKGEYFKDKIIAFLINEPLYKWPTVAKRLMEQRKKNKSK